MTEEEKSETTANGDPHPATPHEGAPSANAPEKAPHEEQAVAGAPVDPDRFRPEAIAERIARVGGETEQERAEREAEEMLAVRKREVGDKRSALEIAASKRLAEIGEKAVRRPAQAVVLNRDMEAIKGPLKWLEGNERLLGGIAAGVLVVGGAIAGIRYWQESRETAASVALSAAIAVENARIEADPSDHEKPERGDPSHTVFKSAAERTDAALAKFRDVETRFKGSGAATIAHLSEASLLLDKGDYEGALAAFEDVKKSPLALADTEIRGRSIEGIGFAYELHASAVPAEKVALLDKAMEAYTELEATDASGLTELARYHEARVWEAKGDKAKATELLQKVYAAVSSPADRGSFEYLKFFAEDRLRALKPDALPPKRKGPGGIDMSDPAVRKMVEEYMQKHPEQGRGAPPGRPTP